MSCLFCDLQMNKENVIYETETIYVVLDRYPLSNRHLLVIPKEHHDVFHKYDEKILTEIVKIVKFLVIKLKMESYNLLQNNINGQIIKHCHMHLVEANDTGKLSMQDTKYLKLNNEEYKQLVSEIKKLI